MIYNYLTDTSPVEYFIMQSKPYEIQIFNSINGDYLTVESLDKGSIEPLLLKCVFKEGTECPLLLTHIDSLFERSFLNASAEPLEGNIYLLEEGKLLFTRNIEELEFDLLDMMWKEVLNLSIVDQLIQLVAGGNHTQLDEKQELKLIERLENLKKQERLQIPIYFISDSFYIIEDYEYSGRIKKCLELLNASGVTFYFLSYQLFHSPKLSRPGFATYTLEYHIF